MITQGELINAVAKIQLMDRFVGRDAPVLKAVGDELMSIFQSDAELATFIERFTLCFERWPGLHALRQTAREMKDEREQRSDSVPDRTLCPECNSRDGWIKMLVVGGPYSHSPRRVIGRWTYELEEREGELLRKEKTTDPAKDDWQLTTEVKPCRTCRKKVTAFETTRGKSAQ